MSGAALLPFDPTLLIEPPTAINDPNWLSAEAEKAVQAFLYEGQSRNTTRTYATALRYWGAWHALRFGRPIEGPVSVTAVLQFVIDHLEHQPLLPAAESTPYTPSSATTAHLLPLAIDELLVCRSYKQNIGPWSMATVKTRLAALSKAHEHYIVNHGHLAVAERFHVARSTLYRNASVNP